MARSTFLSVLSCVCFSLILSIILELSAAKTDPEHIRGIVDLRTIVDFRPDLINLQRKVCNLSVVLSDSSCGRFVKEHSAI